jgi:tight adherence protein B
MIYSFSLLLILGLGAMIWAIWTSYRSALGESLGVLRQWRQWHHDSIAWSRADSAATPSAGRWRMRRSLGSIEAATPELLSFLARAIRAGHSLPTAVLWAGESFPGPLGEAFSRIRTQLHAGMRLQDSLDDLASRYPLAELRMLVLGLRIAQDLGGPLPDLLDQLAANSRARLRLRARVKALSSEARWSGWFLGLLPLAIASGLSVWRPEHMAVLWHDPRGQALSFAAISLSLCGALWMRSMVRHVDRYEN